MKAALTRVLDHLAAIGIEVHIVPGATGFIPGCRIEAGALLVDPECAPSAVLHDAGHVALVPSRFRSYMSDNLGAGMKRMFDDLHEMDLPPDHPLQRAAIQCSDPEATAWAWAAGMAVGLAPEEIILDAEYGGTGAEIRSMLQANQYVGINGLAHAGMCKRGHWVAPEARYPNMHCWLQAA
ncbi:hypothetical protein [Massilia varians]|jgi:hypothetical protein|uniref:hypothetical protein n=1 Tax=Massilia varians TaxID=457921 RepID=UPI002555473D|nr:hypothetical protein [Massilia varians]MDK6079752.1 hypothetical protein [Massilia varians]